MNEMKCTWIVVFVAALSLFSTGCSRGYVLVLNNGTQIRTASKPVLKGGYYVSKDANGQEVFVPKGRVKEIAPASRAPQEKNPFKPTAR